MFWKFHRLLKFKAFNKMEALAYDRFETSFFEASSTLPFSFSHTLYLILYQLPVFFFVKFDPVFKNDKTTGFPVTNFPIDWP